MFVGATTKELHGTSVFYGSLIRELVESGDPLYIFRGADAYLLKPPLLMWLGVAGSKVFGLTQFGVTFAPRLAGVLVVVLTYAVLRRLFGLTAAWFAALTLITNSTFIQFSATLRMDSLLLLGILLSMAGWLYRERAWWGAAFYGGIAIGVLSKGPLGLTPLVLIPLHALLAGEPLQARRFLRWSAVLLLPIVLWYGFLVAEHGVRPFTELASDALKPSGIQGISTWDAIASEYLYKPARRYWPWLPFIVAGFFILAQRVFSARLSRDERANAAWILIWFITTVIVAAVKPDRDIRYLYPALPAMTAFSGVALAALFKQRLPDWLLNTVLAAIVAGAVLNALGIWNRNDTRGTIATMQAEAASRPEPRSPLIAIGGYPLDPGRLRRQNTHRDWIHFYLGEVPIVYDWRALQLGRVDLSNGVYLTNSRGYQARLAEFSLRSRYTSDEMIFALPK